MNCPKCGYAMTDLDVECPRCKRMPEQQATPRPAPAATPPVPPVPLQPKAKDKAAPVVLGTPSRSSALTWVLVGVGVAIVALLAVLLWTQLRKPVSSGQLAEKPLETQAPAQTQGEGLAAGGQTTQQPATTGAGGVAQGQDTNVAPAGSEAGNLAQAQSQNVPPATSNAEGLAQGQQQNVPGATTDAGGLAEGEEESFDPRTVCSWRQVYVTSGSGMKITPALTLHRPWRIRYYTGQMQTSDMPWFIFAISVPTLGVDVVRVYESAPNTQGVMPMGKKGTFPLTVAGTNTVNWQIAVDQGEFCKR